MFATDVDNDGDTDVLSATRNEIDSKIAWYENDGSQNFTAHTITNAALEATSVYAADVDGDGDTDVLSASSYDDKIGLVRERRQRKLHRAHHYHHRQRGQ